MWAWSSCDLTYLDDNNLTFYDNFYINHIHTNDMLYYLQLYVIIPSEARLCLGLIRDFPSSSWWWSSSWSLTRSKKEFYLEYGGQLGFETRRGVLPGPEGHRRLVLDQRNSQE